MIENKGLALAVASLCGFQLLQAWNTNAPSLAELRETPSENKLMKRKLLDADILVGGTALILGGSIAIMTKDKTPLILMGSLFLAIAGWHHVILEQAEWRAE